MKKIKWATTSTAMVLTAALAATAAGNLADNSRDGSGTTPPADPAEASMVTSVSPEQATNFGVLRAPVAADDDTGTGPKGPFGANLRLARKVETSAGVVRVVPANDMVCLRADTATGTAWTCVADKDAVSGRLILSLRQPDSKTREAVFALLPDHATKVSTTANGETRTVSVSENIVALETTDADAIAFTDNAGFATSVPLP